MNTLRYLAKAAKGDGDGQKVSLEYWGQVRNQFRSLVPEKRNTKLKLSTSYRDWAFGRLPRKAEAQGIIKFGTS